MAQAKIDELHAKIAELDEQRDELARILSLREEKA
jgi:hypothetical protein